LIEHRTAQFFGVWRVVVYKRSDVFGRNFCSHVYFEGEDFCRTSAEWPLCRCTVDVTARGANGGGCDTGQGALVSTCLDRKQLFNDAVSSSDCAVSIKGLLVNSELLATGGRGLLELISRN